MFIDRIFSGARQFITRKGWEIIDENHDIGCCNIVATDNDNDLHIIQIGYKDYEYYHNCEYPTREHAEETATTWLMDNVDIAPNGYYSVHFDMLTFTVLNNSRAFVKAHYDYLN